MKLVSYVLLQPRLEFPLARNATTPPQQMFPSTLCYFIAMHWHHVAAEVALETRALCAGGASVLPFVNRDDDAVQAHEQSEV